MSKLWNNVIAFFCCEIEHHGCIWIKSLAYVWTISFEEMNLALPIFGLYENGQPVGFSAIISGTRNRLIPCNLHNSCKWEKNLSGMQTLETHQFSHSHKQNNQVEINLQGVTRGGSNTTSVLRRTKSWFLAGLMSALILYLMLDNGRRHFGGL